VRRSTWLVFAGAVGLAAASCELDVTLGRFNLTGDGGDGMGAFSPGDAGPPCETDPDADADGDGYSVTKGDCNDCDPHVNPNAVEVIHPDPNSEPQDEDCDGAIDEIDPPCDDGLEIDDADPLNAARAIELCKQSKGAGDWGVVQARWVMPDGSDPPPLVLAAYHLGHGILPDFGPNVAPQRGARMVVVSSGSARRPNDAGYQSHVDFDKGYSSAHPPGFPKASPSCPPDVVTGVPHDAAALEVELRAPSNAYGVTFDFDFYTSEWPAFICSPYNDIFLALLSPPPPSKPDGNVSFDSQGNPVSVNNAFLDVCGCENNPPDDCIANGKVFGCALGNSELVGTGFGLDTEGIDHAATSWLVTRAPVVPSSTFTVRFVVYDSGDGLYNSSTLLDNWQWIARPGTDVNTEPIPK
jgi:hypothetical protein